MGIQVEFGEYLSRVRRDVCSRRAIKGNRCPRCASRFADYQNGDESESPQMGQAECRFCDFFWALKGINRMVDTEELPFWMQKPHIDLEGRTPLACLQAGEFDAVIQALWLMDDSPGPSS